jgi:hypothetical protein
MVNRKLPPSKPTTTLDSRISKIEEEQQEHSKPLKEIINYLRGQERQTQNQSTEKEQQSYNSPSPSKSDSKCSSECHRNNKTGHFAKYSLRSCKSLNSQ